MTVAFTFAQMSQVDAGLGVAFDTGSLASRPPPMPATPRVDFRAVFDAECGYVWATLRRLGVA